MKAQDIINKLLVLKLSVQMIAYISGEGAKDTEPIEEIIDSAIAYIKVNQLPEFKAWDQFLIVERNGADLVVEKYNRDQFLPTPVSSKVIKPPVARIARWLPFEGNHGKMLQGQCSLCGCQPMKRITSDTPWKFCPNCGAQMK